MVKTSTQESCNGQGMSTITGIHQEGGTIKSQQSNASTDSIKGKPTSGKQPTNQPGQTGQQMNMPTPEQIQEQKVDEKANKLLNKKKR